MADILVAESVVECNGDEEGECWEDECDTGNGPLTHGKETSVIVVVVVLVGRYECEYGWDE